MSREQQGDVLLTQTDDGGDITAVNGIIEMTGGLATAVYLSLFGGISDWWGNTIEDDPAGLLTGQTEQLLDELPPIPANLQRISEAVKSDLTWLKETGVASKIDVETAIPAAKRLEININVTAVGDIEKFRFVQNWRDDRAHFDT